MIFEPLLSLTSRILDVIGNRAFKTPTSLTLTVIKFRISLKIHNLGYLEIYYHNGKIVKCHLSKTNQDLSNLQELDGIYSKIDNYLQGKYDASDILDLISIPKGLKGLILLGVLAIPRGCVASYNQLAKVTGTSPRVVGRVVSLNELPIIIPCHRVVRSSGELGGYSAGIDVKKRLLNIEGVEVQEGKVSKKYFTNNETLRKRFIQLLSRLRVLT